MGYYIDFVFNPEDNLDNGILVKKFLEAGAELVEKEPLYLRYRDLDIRLVNNEKEKAKGILADIRLSWATDLAEMREKLQYMLELSKRVSCQVCAGQIGRFITPENLDEIMNHFKKQSETVIGLIGKINKG